MKIVSVLGFKNVKLQHFSFYLFRLPGILHYHKNEEKNTNAVNSMMPETILFLTVYDRNVLRKTLQVQKYLLRLINIKYCFCQKFKGSLLNSVIPNFQDKRRICISLFGKIWPCKQWQMSSHLLPLHNNQQNGIWNR